jgi:methyl acetate hydrolase
MDSALSSKLQAFLERAVGSKTAPGLVAVVFSRTSNVAAASAGVRSLDSSPDALPMTLDTVAWMASMSKAVTSVAAIILAEKHAFDLDSHDQLVQILPELELGNQRPVSMIFEGKGEDGNWKMREARVGITLRHLLTHTSGTSIPPRDSG